MLNPFTYFPYVNPPSFPYFLRRDSDLIIFSHNHLTLPNFSFFRFFGCGLEIQDDFQQRNQGKGGKKETK